MHWLYKLLIQYRFQFKPHLNQTEQGCTDYCFSIEHPKKSKSQKQEQNKQSQKEQNKTEQNQNRGEQNKREKSVEREKTKPKSK
jgi:hypothetical protein